MEQKKFKFVIIGCDLLKLCLKLNKKGVVSNKQKFQNF